MTKVIRVKALIGAFLLRQVYLYTELNFMYKNIGEIRRDYSHKSLSEKDVDANAIRQFEKWWEEAVSSKIDEVNAMTLATASIDALPSARIVLLKEVNEKGFVFFTNYESYKAQQLAENPKACLVFFWKELERQVRITGLIEKITVKQSDDYFQSRPEASRIGAWASPQSRVIENRDWLDEKFNELVNKMEGTAIPRPPYWGGYIVKPVVIEFWQGRPSRLHDRIQYTLEENGKWKIERLAP
ncbi:MAG TPA: pyridoxamine 5'-phosphate oxidase [Chitinophagaceae bacterium]|nr:pyridoxamine 5'-phosphate oxidase [Chitinophagaceae bacterium]